MTTATSKLSSQEDYGQSHCKYYMQHVSFKQTQNVNVIFTKVEFNDKQYC